MLSDLFPPPEERARSFAIYAIGGTSGMFLSYPFGSWLSDTFGWRSVFLAIGLFLWSRRSFRHLSLGAGLHASVSYAVGSFLVSFYVRSFGIEPDNLTRVAVPLGIAIGLGGAVGNLLGGSLADLLGRRDKRWYPSVCGISTLLAIPLAFASFLARDRA